ncbi:MAG: Rieske 2Fe-2S domain-containing protein [Xanthomonadales bacterium]|nr:Rieske 2Fe-2S domain-containing protein [Xanthomonadales bacterium]
MVDIDRRDFIKKGAAGVAVTSACLCGVNGCATYTGISNTPAANPDSITFDGSVLTVNLSSEPALRQVGGAVKVRNSDLPDELIIARVEENRFVIASLLCTHRGVELEYDRENTRFKCPSLGSSVFALDGANVSGMARKPLRTYEAVLESNSLTIRV